MNNNPIRWKDRFWVFGAPAIEDAEIQEVVSTMKTGWLGTDPKVMSFEKDFKAYKGSEYAI
jgi:dTDP-4-amino-4,6-dideoxygalactose transaminase